MAITGPIALYSNVPVNISFYKPQVYEISAITLGVFTTVTTTADMDYTIGQEVRLIIPPDYGTRGLNNKTAFVISLPDTDQVELNINSTGLDTFVDAGLPTPAQILAVGDINTGYQSSTGPNVSSIEIPGSFINIG